MEKVMIGEIYLLPCIVYQKNYLRHMFYLKFLRVQFGIFIPTAKSRQLTKEWRAARKTKPTP